MLAPGVRSRRALLPPQQYIPTTFGNILCAGHLPYALAQLGLAYILHWSNTRAQEFELEPAGMILAASPSCAQGLQ